ncbi:MAG: hypothetical protein ACUVQP_04215 [Bacteroidales bacterium]
MALTGINIVEGTKNFSPAEYDLNNWTTKISGIKITVNQRRYKKFSRMPLGTACRGINHTTIKSTTGSHFQCFNNQIKKNAIIEVNNKMTKRLSKDIFIRTF